MMNMSDSETSSLGKADDQKMLNSSLDDDEDSSSWESMDEDEGENLCRKISQNTLVLEKVFEYLTFHELLDCRQVSKLWNNTALLQNNLGSRANIRVTNTNIEKLLQTTEKSSSVFCRQFGLHSLDLDASSFLPFNKWIKHNLRRLSLNCCSASSPKLFTRLFRSPTLREISIIGTLPEFASEKPFRRYRLPRVSTLELSASDDRNQISQNFMKTLLLNYTFLQSISIGNSDSLWKDFALLAPNFNLKIRELKVFNITDSLEAQDFEFLQRLRIQSVSFQNCIIWQQFLHDLLERNSNSLQTLKIIGPQHEILNESFYGIPLNLLTSLTLPIDGISSENGRLFLQAMPNIQQLNVIGLFSTKFLFCRKQLTIIGVDGFPDGEYQKRTSETSVDQISEIRREFHKILTLFRESPLKLKVNLPELNNKALRRIFQLFPDLEELSVTNNSRHAIDGWTGIPSKRCRKISACRSFAVCDPSKVQRLPSVSSLKKLKRLEIAIIDDPPKAEFTLLYILYGICQLSSLEELKLQNFTISDVALLALSKCLRLKKCYINGSQDLWNQFKTSCQQSKTKIRSFLLPPKMANNSFCKPLENSKIIHRIFFYLPRNDVYNLRLVSKMWHTSANAFLHGNCDSVSAELEMNQYLEHSNKYSCKSQPSPNKTPRKILVETQSRSFTRTLKVLQEESTITKLVLRGMNKSMLEYYQRENIRNNFKCNSKTCEDRRKIIYWFYPDGNDELIVPSKKENPQATSLILIGSWGRKDTGLLEFLDTPCNINSIVLHGLFQEVYDLILPKLTAMRNLESLAIMPFSSDSITEINRNHLQILSNSSFGLKHLVMQKLQAPPETITDLIKSHRYTLETLSIQNHVNVSDRLPFTIPNLSVLKLDEPPGALLWTSLNINHSVESMHFERSGYIYNQIKSKAMPKLELVDEGFEHSATNMLCDVNLFLECDSNKRLGAQKSILQEGSDSALKFFSHFRFLTCLTLRSVHAHFGLLQGIFRNFSQLEKLIFTNTTGITDEIMTGIPKYLLDKMDLMNPLNFKKAQNELKDFSIPSIRNLKNLKYLNLDDQTNCTDISVIFGILRLHRLEYFSCKKWKITDVSLRAVGDITSIKHMITEGSSGVSRNGMEYFRNKSRNRLSS